MRAATHRDRAPYVKHRVQDGGIDEEDQADGRPTPELAASDLEPTGDPAVHHCRPLRVDACPGQGGGVRDRPRRLHPANDRERQQRGRDRRGPGFYFENLDFLGKAITLRSSGGAAATFLGQRGLDSVVKCISGEGPDTVLGGEGAMGEDYGFTIWLGAAPDGGGMLNVDSSPTVINCEFRSNTALNAGGGMSNRTCDPLFMLCGDPVTSNNPIVGSHPTVMKCLFNQNSATAGPGGGVHNDAVSHPTIIDCTFIQNNGASGGGAFNGGGHPEYTNCTFTNNSANRAAVSSVMVARPRSCTVP